MNYIGKILSILIISIPGTLFGQKAIDSLFASAASVVIPDEMQGMATGNLQVAKGYRDFLEKGILQTTWNIEKKGKTTGIKLMTLSYDETIFFWQLYRVRSGEVEILNQRDEFNRLSSLNSSISSIDIELLGHKGNRSVFGSSCYESGSPTPEGILMLEYVRKRKVKELTDWLTCINPVKRVYAYFGLTLLEQKGHLVIDDSMKKEMTMVHDSPIPVYTCSGCTDLDYKLPREILIESNERILKLFNHLVYH